MESQKTLEELARQMDEQVTQLEAMGPAMRALGDVQLLVCFDDLKARFAPAPAPATVFFNAVRA